MVGPSSRNVHDWPLVGRERELDRITEALAHGALAGVVLAGAPGVGKSRIGREALRLATERGFATAHAVATRSASPIPLGALAALLPTVESRPERRDAIVPEALAALACDRDQPLALLVDDAHLLDPISATVLLHLAMSPSVFVIATVRTGDPVPDAVVACWREDALERIEVASLDRAETGRFVHGALDGPVDGRTQRDLWHASLGNALVLRELVLGALETDRLHHHDGMWQLTQRLAVTPRLVELVHARLADTSPDERTALELLALGEPLDLAMLVALTSAEAVDSIERRELVEVVATGGRAVRLAHPTYGEVLRTETTALRAMSRYGLLADTVERTGRWPREDVARFAVWRLEGGGDVDPDVMLEAARHAYFASDVHLAERLARAVFDQGGDVEAALLLGELLAGTGRSDDAEVLLAGAMDVAGNDRQRALLAMARADALYWGLGREDDARTAIEEAELAVSAPLWRRELAGVRATYALLGGQPQAAIDAVAPLLENAEGRPLVEAATVAAPALAVAGHTDEAIAIADRALAARAALGDQQVLADAGIHAAAKVLALGVAGRLDEGVEAATHAYDAALEARATDGVAWAALMRGWIAVLRGQLETAARCFREGAAAFADVGQVGPRRWCYAGVALASGQAGDAAASDRAITALDALPPSPLLMMETEVERARGWHAVAQRDLVGARRYLRDAAARARDDGSFALEAGALHDLARTGAADAASDRLGELVGVVDGSLVAGRASHADAIARQDGDALDDCADVFEALGAMLFGAEAAAGAAAVHRRADAARRAQRASTRASALRARCEAPATPLLALAGPAGMLTPRERDVATLAAEGVSSSVIAERLVIGVRTVETHLQHAYEKLGVHSRGELARALPDGVRGSG